MKIQSKFSEGDKVWCATVEYSDNEITCPDCLGTLHWVVVFADGDAVEIDCQTCKHSFESPSGRIRYKNHKPCVRLLTIGSVRYDKEFSYMCAETGIGSGQIHYEKDLFLRKDEAEKRAKKNHEQQMKSIANNNFSKKFGGTKKIEESLSTWGFSRKLLFEKVQQFREWAELSGIVRRK